MRVIFIGSGELGCPALRAISAAGRDEIAMVVSQPDRPKGRRRHLAPSALKQHSEALGLPVITPENINSPESIEQIRLLEPDIFVVASYGQFLGSKLLSLPATAAINIHPSLLPRYRGAAPIQWAIINGDEQTGVTILFIDQKMDAGDIILQKECPILPEDSSATLKPRLARIGADMTLEVLDQFRAGSVASRPQDERAVVLAPKFEKSDGRIDFKRPARDIVNRARGLYPWPCCFFEDQNGQPVRLIRVGIAEGEGAPATIVGFDEDGPLLGTGENLVRLLKVQPPGKREMSGLDYCNGRRLAPGDRIK